MSGAGKLTLTTALKVATVESHARLAALPFFTALGKGQLPLESYVGQLRAMAVIHGTLEHEFSQLEPDTLKALLFDRPSRLVHLRKDLGLFDSPFVPDIKAALEPVRRIAEQIRLYRAGQPTDLLAVLYVLQGTTLGNTVHLPDVLKTFGSRTSAAAHYYAGYGNDTAKHWQEFSAAMNAFPLAQNEHSRLVKVAQDLFDQLETLYSALYPIQLSGMVFTASMLNPEAGQHAVPQDPKEIEAALAAEKKCGVEFPYFRERYQERGKSFGRSDAAWLATLAELPQTQLLAQVEWLGRLLGNRGIPRLTLERQLELLHAELAAAVPGKVASYRGLLEGAGSLKAERLRRIPEALFNRLEKEFRAATADELQGRFRGTGKLIISAVCDQEAGIANAVGSLQPWLTDAARFSPQWIAAVLRTLEQARAGLKR